VLWGNGAIGANVGIETRLISSLKLKRPDRFLKPVRSSPMKARPERTRPNLYKDSCITISCSPNSHFIKKISSLWMQFCLFRLYQPSCVWEHPVWPNQPLQNIRKPLGKSNQPLQNIRKPLAQANKPLQKSKKALSWVKKKCFWVDGAWFEGVLLV